MSYFLDPLGLAPKQDYIVLAAAGVSLASPGRATITGAGSPRNWNKAQGFGFSGATLMFAGTDLSEFDVRIDLWTSTHFVQWEAFAVLLSNPPPPIGTLPTSLAIEHPRLNAKPWCIDKVVVKDVSSWEQSESGLWSTTIKFSQYRPRKPALLKPLEGPPGVGVAPKPVDPAEALIQQLDAENATLRAKL